MSVRAAFLVALGLLLGRVDSPPLVILAYYGLLFVVALPVLGLGPRALAVLAVVAAVVTPVVSHLLRQSVDPTPIAEPWGADLLTELLLTGTYPVLSWTTYLLAGMARGPHRPAPPPRRRAAARGRRGGRRHGQGAVGRGCSTRSGELTGWREPSAPPPTR